VRSVVVEGWRGKGALAGQAVRGVVGLWGCATHAAAGARSGGVCERLGGCWRGSDERDSGEGGLR